MPWLRNSVNLSFGILSFTKFNEFSLLVNSFICSCCDALCLFVHVKLNDQMFFTARYCLLAFHVTFSLLSLYLFALPVVTVTDFVVKGCVYLSSL